MFRLQDIQNSINSVSQGPSNHSLEAWPLKLKVMGSCASISAVAMVGSIAVSGVTMAHEKALRRRHSLEKARCDAAAEIEHQTQGQADFHHDNRRDNKRDNRKSGDWSYWVVRQLHLNQTLQP